MNVKGLKKRYNRLLKQTIDKEQILDNKKFDPEYKEKLIPEYMELVDQLNMLLLKLKRAEYMASSKEILQGFRGEI